jgi:hypothetical protein
MMKTIYPFYAKRFNPLNKNAPPRFRAGRAMSQALNVRSVAKVWNSCTAAEALSTAYGNGQLTF